MAVGVCGEIADGLGAESPVEIAGLAVAGVVDYKPG